MDSTGRSYAADKDGGDGLARLAVRQDDGTWLRSTLLANGDGDDAHGVSLVVDRWDVMTAACQVMTGGIQWTTGQFFARNEKLVSTLPTLAVLASHAHPQCQLDRRVERQDSGADGKARMASRLAKDLEQKLAGTVQDPGLPSEIRRRGDEAFQAEDTANPIEAAQLGAQRGEGIQDGLAGIESSLLGRHFAADSPLAGKGATDERQRASGHREPGGAQRNRRHVGAGGRRRRRQYEAKFC